MDATEIMEGVCMWLKIRNIAPSSPGRHVASPVTTPLRTQSILPQPSLFS